MLNQTSHQNIHDRNVRYAIQVSVNKQSFSQPNIKIPTDNFTIVKNDKLTIIFQMI